MLLNVIWNTAADGLTLCLQYYMCSLMSIKPHCCFPPWPTHLFCPKTKLAKHFQTFLALLKFILITSVPRPCVGVGLHSDIWSTAGCCWLMQGWVWAGTLRRAFTRFVMSRGTTDAAEGFDVFADQRRFRRDFKDKQLQRLELGWIPKHHTIHFEGGGKLPVTWNSLLNILKHGWFSGLDTNLK